MSSSAVHQPASSLATSARSRPAPSLPRPARQALPAHPARLPRPAHGNQALQQLLRSGTGRTLQPVHPPGDPWEREADRVAEAVTRSAKPAGPAAAQVAERAPAPSLARSPERPPAPPLTSAPTITPLPSAATQRQCAACAAEEHDEAPEPQVQRQAVASASASVSARATATVAAAATPPAGGAPLAPDLRGFFEPRFGRDLSGVRVHTGAGDAESARQLQARAYTRGSHIVFAAGEYAPLTPAGRRLLAHEITHVLQQAGRPDVGADAGAGAPIQRQCSSANMSACSDEDLLTAVCIGEAGNIKDAQGQQGVMNVVQNQTKDRIGGTVATNAKRILDAETNDPPKSIDRLGWKLYSTCRPLAQGVLSGKGGDPTGGAVFFDQCCERECDQSCTGYLGDGTTGAHYFGRRATAAEQAACQDSKQNPKGVCPNFCNLPKKKNLAHCDNRCCATPKKKGPVPSYPGQQPPAAAPKDAAQSAPSSESSPAGEAAPAGAAQSPGSQQPGEAAAPAAG